MKASIYVLGSSYLVEDYLLSKIGDKKYKMSDYRFISPMSNTIIKTGNTKPSKVLSKKEYSVKYLRNEIYLKKQTIDRVFITTRVFNYMSIGEYEVIPNNINKGSITGVIKCNNAQEIMDKLDYDKKAVICVGKSLSYLSILEQKDLNTIIIK